MTVLDFATSTTTIAPARTGALTAVRLHDSLWRVTRADGDVAGYIERLAEERGVRYRAKRLIVRQQSFVSIGEFWSMDDALQCLRMN